MGAVHQWRLNSVVRQKTELSTYSWKMVWNNYLTKWIEYAESCTVKHNFSTMVYFFRYHFYKKWKFYDFLIIMEVFYILYEKKLYMIKNVIAKYWFWFELRNSLPCDIHLINMSPYDLLLWKLDIAQLAEQILCILEYKWFLLWSEKKFTCSLLNLVTVKD